MRHLTVLAVLAAVMGALQAAPAAILSDGDFSVPIAQSSWMAGTHGFYSYYTNTLGGSPANLEATGGNPDAHLRLRQFGSHLMTALPAPAGEQSWTVSFDWARPNSWGNANFEVWAFSDGDELRINNTLYGADAVVTGGEKLRDIVLPTSSSWVGQSFDFTVPAGYDAVALVWFMDGSDNNGRIDNLVVTPEPASLAMLALGGLALLRRRR